MHKQIYQDILARVQTPSRYTGNEINSIQKDPEKADITFALVFPDLYEIGTSHFGLQILYAILNNQENIAAERFFAPAPDMEALMAEKKIPCLSMESKKPLDQFDVIGVSLLYELNFTNILTLFKLSGIPFFSGQRNECFPLVIGGGPCAFNPEPLADFFDAFVIGDGEQTSIEISKTVIDFKNQGDGNKQTLLKMLSKIQGVYIPSFFDTHINDSGFQILTPVFEDYAHVRRSILPELTRDLFPLSPILPFAKPVHDRLRLEVARGCSRGCRFCQAGMIYRPVRERSIEDLVSIAKESLKTTGYSDISLLSLSTGDYSSLPQLMTRLLALDSHHCNAVSLPSVRAEKLTPELMEIIRQVRKTGFTIAPEAGSQRLRDIINKNLTRESIEAAVENAFELGWKNIKLYFMMGLPFETMTDVQAVCDMSKHLAASFAKGKKNINVSTTSFIPKAHTPFQWRPQISLEETKEKLQYLKDNLRHPKVNLKWQDPEMSRLEGVWARGDRRLSKLLVEAFELGCRLDGWTDRFDKQLWNRAFEKTGIDPDFYTTRVRSLDEPLPWGHIDAGISVKFLKKEYEKAEQGALTPDCRENNCTGCGICDFKTIKPVIHPSAEAVDATPVSLAKQNRMPDEDFQKFDLTYTKLGQARFFGHLELATMMQRAVKRAGLIVKYSKGFNPMMRLSFENALPVGMESEEEHMFVYLDKALSPRVIVRSLNDRLPQGIEITGCERFRKNSKIRDDLSRYQVRLPQNIISRKAVSAFLEKEMFMVEDLSKKGKIRKSDLRKSVEKICFDKENCLKMVLRPLETRTIRPSEILQKVFEIDEKTLSEIRVRKIAAKTRSDLSDYCPAEKDEKG